MSNPVLAPIGEIFDFEIHLVDDYGLSASLEIKVDDQYLTFGGPDYYSSIPNAGADLRGTSLNVVSRSVGQPLHANWKGNWLKSAF